MPSLPATASQNLGFQHLLQSPLFRLCSVTHIGSLVPSIKFRFLPLVSPLRRMTITFALPYVVCECEPAGGGKESQVFSTCLGLGVGPCSASPAIFVSGLQCNASVDLIGTCWPRSPAGQLVVRPCPAFFYGVRYNTTSKGKGSGWAICWEVGGIGKAHRWGMKQKHNADNNNKYTCHWFGHCWPKASSVLCWALCWFLLIPTVPWRTLSPAV